MSGARGGGSAFPHAAAELQALEVFDDVENMLSNAQQSGGNIGGGQQQAQQQAPLQGSSLRAARGLVASSSAPSLIPHSGQQQPAKIEIPSAARTRHREICRSSKISLRRRTQRIAAEPLYCQISAS